MILTFFWGGFAINKIWEYLKKQQSIYFILTFNVKVYLRQRGDVTVQCVYRSIRASHLALKMHIMPRL